MKKYLIIISVSILAIICGLIFYYISWSTFSSISNLLTFKHPRTISIKKDTYHPTTNGSVLVILLQTNNERFAGLACVATKNNIKSEIYDNIIKSSNYSDTLSIDHFPAIFYSINNQGVAGGVLSEIVFDTNNHGCVLNLDSKYTKQYKLLLKIAKSMKFYNEF